jgi:hypothetical protein
MDNRRKNGALLPKGHNYSDCKAGYTGMMDLKPDTENIKPHSFMQLIDENVCKAASKIKYENSDQAGKMKAVNLTYRGKSKKLIHSVALELKRR